MAWRLINFSPVFSPFLGFCFLPHATLLNEVVKAGPDRFDALLFLGLRHQRQSSHVDASTLRR